MNLEGAGRVLRDLYSERLEKQLIEEMIGTFEPDPYPRKAEYVEVPLSRKKIAKLEAAADLLGKYDLYVEGLIPTTERKRRWLETKEEWQHRLATLPEHRADWIRQQLAEGKKPPRSALWWDADYREAVGVKDVQTHYGTYVTIPVVKQTPID